MNFKFLGVILMVIFIIVGTSCKSGKNCNGGGWYGNRNLGYEATTDQQPTINAEYTECVLSTEICATP